MQAFHSLLRGLYESAQDDKLGAVRRQAWETYLRLGLPKLSNLYTGNFRPAVSQGVSEEKIREHVTSDAYLIFVNGQFVPKLSRAPSGLVVTPLHEAYSTYNAFLKGRISQSLKSERDPFSALNGALHHQGAFLYLPPNATLPPLQVLHFLTEEEMMASPRIHLFAGARSKIELQVSIVGNASWINSYTDLALEEGAEVRVTSSASKDLSLMDGVHATLKRDALLEVRIKTSGKMVRPHWSVQLLGENAEARLFGAANLEGSSQFHPTIWMEHVAPHCRSHQHFKHVLKDSARSNFEGEIYVHQEAQKTEAFQLNNNLLLSDDAKASSKPNLEIFADDVKASHGATVGQFDKEVLFYLRSRGYTESQAKALLVEAFLREVA